MKRLPVEYEVSLGLSLDDCEIGPVLDPMGEAYGGVFAGWQTPLAPWGGFRLPSGLAVVDDGGDAVLEFNGGEPGRPQERALVGEEIYGDGQIAAELRFLAEASGPHMDRMEVDLALAGVVFRQETSRRYYQFGVEGGRRAVLYRRQDDEWTLLAQQEVSVPDGYLELQVWLDGGGIRCRCAGLNVDFFVTDEAYPYGKVGVRALGKARLARFAWWQSPGQRRDDGQRRQAALAAVQVRGDKVPDAVWVRTFEHEVLGGAPRFVDLAVEGRFDLLVEGQRPRALTATGEVLWEGQAPLHGVVCSRDCGPQGRLLYGFTGERSRRQAANVTGKVDDQVVWAEMCVLSGKDGQVLAKGPVPDLHETARRPDYATTDGRLTAAGGDIVLREWRDDKEGGGVNLWAYDADLQPLWHVEQQGAWYGHHWAVRFCDVDGDGNDELLAGGKLYDAGGQLLWVHDRDAEMLRITGARHYDAVAVGDLGGDDELDPTAFLISGSAGVYVVDALTGRTRARHAVGHAQGCVLGKVRPDLPGTEVLVATRWGNMGILTLFSGRGQRLWTIQPDYIGQGAVPVRWGDGEAQLIWTNTSAQAQALYDGYGRCVKELPALRRLWGQRPRRAVGGQPLRLGDDGVEYLGLTLDGQTQVFGPEA